MLKLAHRGLLAITLLASSFTAAEAAVLLEKVTSPGFTIPAYAITTHCSLTDDGRLIRQHNLGFLMSKRVFPIQLSVTALKAEIQSAALGMVTSEMFPVDAPTQTYRAYVVQAGVAPKPVLLYQENGGTGQKRTNNSPAALTLRNFINLNCGDPL